MSSACSKICRSIAARTAAARPSRWSATSPAEPRSRHDAGGLGARHTARLATERGAIVLVPRTRQVHTCSARHGSPAMKLYMHPVSMTSRPVRLFIAENKIEVEEQLVDLMTGEHLKDPYASLN